MTDITTALLQIKQQIYAAEQRYHRRPGSVKLLAVSKTQPVIHIQSAITAKQTEFAENYLQEALHKIKEINNPDLTWHFIGRVQSNKANKVARDFHWVHSVDRLKIAHRLNAARPAHLPPINICLQINISGERSKLGIPLSALNKLIGEAMLLPNVKVRGLMALPAPSADFDQQRRPFRQLRKLFDQLRQTYPSIDTLSMGTTHDMLAAIAEGATIVRIGTAIFGKRNRLVSKPA